MASLSEQTEKVGFIGAGNMASALVRGLVRGGLSASQILVSDVDWAKVEALVSELGVVGEANNAKLVERSEIVVLAVKPAATCKLAQGLRALSEGRLWLSVAAGVTTSQLEGALGGRARVMRAMPNTPCLVGQGATGLCRGKLATASDERTAQNLLDAVGITEVVDETMMDAVTALSGSGPAFIMLVVESMADGAVRAGLPRSIAQRLATQTVLGAASLLKETGQHPGQLKDMVTSPGGTTIAGIEALEAAGMRGAFIAAVTKAAERSRVLSQS